MTVAVFENAISISIVLRSYFSVFSLVLVPIEKIYQTLKTVFGQTSKHLEVRQKYSATRHQFSTLSSVLANMLKHGLSCLINYINLWTTFYQYYNSLILFSWLVILIRLFQNWSRM